MPHIEAGISDKSVLVAIALHSLTAICPNNANVDALGI